MIRAKEGNLSDSVPNRVLADVVGVPVWLVRGRGPRPLGVPGTVVDAQPGVLQLAVATAGELEVGDEVALAFAPNAGFPLRAVGRVEALGPDGVSVRLKDLVPTERREYPRLPSELSVHFRQAPPGFSTEAWLERGSAELLRVPARIVDFSVAGVAFQDPAPPENGSTLLLEFGHPGRDRRWRCVGRVVRVQPLKERPDAGWAEVGVVLDDVPPGTTRMLVREMLRVQRGLRLA